MASKTTGKTKTMVKKSSRKVEKKSSAKVKAKSKTRTVAVVKSTNDASIKDVVKSSLKEGPLRHVLSSAGLERINKESYAILRGHMKDFLTEFLSELYKVTKSDSRNTINALDLDKVLESRGYDDSVRFDAIMDTLESAKKKEEKVLYIALANMGTLVRRLTSEFSSGEEEKSARFAENVIKVVQFVFEKELTNVITPVIEITKHSNRNTVQPKDVELYIKLYQMMRPCVKQTEVVS